jgi:UDP-GlcNAc:undecaprenyl-phosphate GlcNAc-1-phosphate transferase
MESINLIPTLVSFFISFSITPVLINIAKKKGLNDVPDNSELKIHKAPIPNIGGLVVFISITPTLLLSSPFVYNQSKDIYNVIIGCLLIMALGISDDLKGINPSIRFLGQFLISIIVISFGFKINTFPSLFLNLITTSFIIIVSINAINLLDGMDGLATGVSAICCLGFIGIGTYQNNTFVSILSLILFGSLIGFLPYNFNPAKIFLGDSGSTLIGFLLALLIISSASQLSSLPNLIPPILIVGLPFFDTAYTIIRRVRNKKSVFIGDREHFYDKLNRKGFSQRQTAVIGYSLSLMCTVMGLGIYKIIN